MLPTTAQGGGVPDAELVIAGARLAEQAGFDSVHVGDHLLHPHPMLEALVTLGFVAASTERIAFGPCVMLLALREPVALAKQLSTLAAFAPGRLRLGVGVGGEYPDEFDAVGIPLDERGQRLGERVIELRSLLATGRDDRFDATVIGSPGDVPPVVFGGWHEASLRRAARLGDGWIGYLLNHDGFARRRRYLAEQRQQLDLTAPFTFGMLVPVLHDPAEGASARAAALWSGLTQRSGAFPTDRFAAGSADAIVTMLAGFEECDEVILAPADQGSGFLDHIAVLGDVVLPRLRAAS